ncbi:MAG: hypothetical protein QXQ02_01080 [Halobacteria archaeon]
MEIVKEKLLHTGSTLLNLALSGTIDGGYIKGRYFYIVGDSSTGKTFLTLTALAEASINANFDDYRLIYDDVEGGALMDIEQYFGEKLAARIEPPAGTRALPKYSTTVEEFYFYLDDAFNKNKPFIYVLDSQDALDSTFSQRRFRELKAVRYNRSAEKVKGDYGDGKAKFHSTRLREVVHRLRDSGSILLIVNQTRDVLDANPFGEKSQTSGGRALRFYATAQIWLYLKERIYKIVHKKKRQVGVKIKVAVKKNRITGKEWSIDLPIYFSYGIDDITSCIEFLLEELRWKQEGKKIIATDFDSLEGSIDDIIKYVEDNHLEHELFEIVYEQYKELEEKCKIKRKTKYDRLDTC